MLQKNSVLDVLGVVDLPLSLLGQVFERYLSVELTGQLVTYSKIVRVAKSDIQNNFSEIHSFQWVLSSGHNLYSN